MNQLPNVASAIVAEAKIRDYLLNPANAQNSGKAALFAQFGFSRDRWQELSIALGQHPIENQIVSSIESAHGAKFVVRCNLATPDRRNPCMTSIWIIETGQSAPRLVTAY